MLYGNLNTVLSANSFSFSIKSWCTWVNYDNNMKVYQAWRDELTRPLNSSDTLRRPKHIKRPAVPLSHKAYSVKIND